MSNDRKAWIHIFVRGGVVQQVRCDLPATVILEDHDADEPFLGNFSAEPWASDDLAKLLQLMNIPHRVVREDGQAADTDPPADEA